MRIVLFVLGGGLIVAGVFALFSDRVAEGNHRFKFGEREVTSTNAGVFLAGLGVIVVLTVWLTGFGTHPGSPAPNASGPLPAAPTATPAQSRALHPSAAETTSLGPVVGIHTPSPEQTSTPLATSASPQQHSTPSLGNALASPEGSPSAGPPWVGDESGLSLIVESIAMSATFPGREVLNLRLENDSGYDLAVPISGFLAVDNHDMSYPADNPNSTMPFESDESGLAVLGQGPFPNGTTRRGTVLLAAPVEASATILQIRFTVAYQDPNDYPLHIHFTVSVDTPVARSSS